jgi:hypothetical protein
MWSSVPEACGAPVGVQVRVLGLAAVILCNNLNMYEIMEVRRGFRVFFHCHPRQPPTAQAVRAAAICKARCGQ